MTRKAAGMARGGWTMCYERTDERRPGMGQAGRRPGAMLALVWTLALLVGACGSPIAQPAATAVVPAVEPSTPGPVSSIPGALAVEVPPLPFPDNPDPNECGIPTLWGKDDPSWVTGYYQGQLVQPVVSLYDSHARREVAGQIPHGSRVRIKLTQANPALNYFLVRSLDLDPPQEGWVPVPFVSLDGPPPPAP